MKNQLTQPRVAFCNATRHNRPFFRVCAFIAGLPLTAVSLWATLNHAPSISWIPDQRITSGTFVTQYFRVINFDGGTPPFMKMITSTPTNWYSTLNISIAACDPGNDTGCASDGTGWKITFANTPTTSGRATVTIKVTGSTGNSGRTSFTLQVDTNTANSARNPPSIATLPNYALQQNSTTNKATYTAQFAIGDLGSSDNKEDVASIASA